MIGQNNILSWVNDNVDNFPHFIVLIGSSGCGKRTLSKVIANKLSCVYAECSVTVDAVREVIDSSYQSKTRVLYCFADADNMRPQAKNAMLKITEEPPENAYFCLTVTDSSSLLDTIKSRAMVFNMEAYTEREIAEYAIDKYNSSEYNPAAKDDLPIIKQLCGTPGEVNMLVSYEPRAFMDYVQLVFENIAEVEPANAFKSSNKLALKNDEGYDLALFLKGFTYFCIKAISPDDDLDKTHRLCEGIIVTTKALNKVGKLGVNKQQLYDKWVFEIREKWLESN